MKKLKKPKQVKFEKIKIAKAPKIDLNKLKVKYPKYEKAKKKLRFSN